MKSLKKMISAFFISLIACGGILIAIPKIIFAQEDAAGEVSADFSSDVNQGKQELEQDPEAQTSQLQILDGEDQVAGDQVNSNVNEFSTVEDAQINQEEIQNNQEGVQGEDINTSEVTEVKDSEDLTQQSQEVMDNQQQEQEQQTQQEDQQSQDQQQEEQTQQDQLQKDQQEQQDASTDSTP